MDKPLSKLSLAMSAGFCVFAGAACSEHGVTDPVVHVSKPISVQETFDQLRRWHAAGSYTAIRPYIDSTGCEGAIDLLVAVDQLMAANADFLAAVRKTCPDVNVSPYDLAFTRDNLDLFSRRVDWVSVKEEGDRAVVTAGISGRLPLSEIQFQRHKDRWVYVPGTENPAVIKAIRQMTRSLNQIELVALQGKPTDREIHEEYRVRILLKMRGLKELGGISPGL